jgi:hypothetical protein
MRRDFEDARKSIESALFEEESSHDESHRIPESLVER